MKSVVLAIIILIFSTSPVVAEKAKAKKRVVEDKPQLKTEMSFRDSTVLGQYAKSSEANAAVEPEKQLIKVVEPRENFSRQLVKSKEWK